MKPVVIGVGGPVGSGKTLLIERLTRIMNSEYKCAVITNDIYTKEDAKFMVKNSVLTEDHVIGVETGGCPHTAIREDASMNFAALESGPFRKDRMSVWNPGREDVMMKGFAKIFQKSRESTRRSRENAGKSSMRF